ncbi:transcription factor Adf-1-like [Sinocyclocheilus anshuiensis]|uniref:Transcription factor Adf-1-like n=1 Tax=Sinocyclocheilus anshuiensis TaxID=1608454 RepID=A0A671M2T0_9TELE|nr:PREDICTED: transcription factor Adf-1-like [Sinocyclocheilus anshuiensis]
MAVTEKLIQSVHAYPVLYNVSLHDYRSAERRVKAWREVAASVGLSVVECKRRWKTIRDRFIRERRLCQLRREEGGRRLHFWPHRESLSFLEAHVRKKKRVAEHPDDSLDECSGGDSKPGLETDKQFESKLQPVTQLPPGPKLPQTPAPTVTSELHGKTEKEKEAFDEDELFLLSYVPALKRLTPQKRAAVKMQIQQIMFDAEFKEQL